MGAGELARAPKASCFQTVVSNHQAARRDASPHLGGDSAGGDGTPPLGSRAARRDASPHRGRLATCCDRIGGRSKLRPSREDSSLALGETAEQRELRRRRFVGRMHKAFVRRDAELDMADFPRLGIRLDHPTRCRVAERFMPVT